MHYMPIKVAIVDDHQIVLDGIISLLRDNARIAVVAGASSASAMLEMLQTTPVDVLITDIYMPEMNGRELARAVRTQYPAIRILALSMNGEGSLVDELINDADISGYVLKNIGKEDLSAAIEKIHGGGIYFSEERLNELASFSQIKAENATAHLTRREIEIINLIDKELSNKDIADKLFISERTVETHRKNIFRKTNTNSLIGLIKYAWQHKLIENTAAGNN